MRKAERERSNTMVSLRLPAPLLKALSSRAESTGRTVSETVRELLAAGLSEWTSTESEVRSLRDEVRGLRQEIRAALGQKGSKR